jgi:trk system potassium uptake protein TrkH
LLQRSLLQESISAPQLGGIVKLTGFIFKVAFLVELLGALMMMPVFCGEYGLHGIWMSVFHSISAFCNAGFDIFGVVEPGSSLITFQSDPVVLLTISALIIIGGLGFLVWQEIVSGRKWKLCGVYTKLVIIANLVLLVGGAAAFLALEWNNPQTLGPMALGDKLLNGFFQSVTTRTAGFASFDQVGLSDGGKGVSMVLMLIGGSSGSTAGGVKTVTVMVLMLFLWSRLRGRNTVTVFKRTIPAEQVLDAMTLTGIMVVLAVFGAVFISATSAIGFTDSLYEAVSALATVGLTAGSTGKLSLAGKLLIILYMYFGRVGVLTLSMGFLLSDRAEERIRYAQTNLLIG